MVKVAAKSLPVGQILVWFGLGGALLFAGAALYKGERLFQADVVSRPMLLRGLLEVLGRLFILWRSQPASLRSEAG